jgi:transcriptional regulator NrdR family protein
VIKKDGKRESFDRSKLLRYRPRLRKNRHPPPQD